jgi:hypothetical protein
VKETVMLGFLLGFALMGSVMAGLILLEVRRESQPIEPAAKKLRQWRPRRAYRTLR